MELVRKCPTCGRYLTTSILPDHLSGWALIRTCVCGYKEQPVTYNTSDKTICVGSIQSSSGTEKINTGKY